jgi:spore maturation protein CgeB
MGAGGFLLTNYQAELAEFFVDGEEMVIYENFEDMKNKIKYYLEHDDERNKIAANGKEKVRQLFSYEERIKLILEFVDSLTKNA